jgi:hypothetical protein
MAFVTLPDSSAQRVGQGNLQLYRRPNRIAVNLGKLFVCVCLQLLSIIWRVYDELSLSGDEVVFSGFSALF